MAKEYTTHTLVVGLCKSKELQIEYTVSYTHQQNGKADQINRTIEERARTVLLDSKF